MLQNMVVPHMTPQLVQLQNVGHQQGQMVAVSQMPGTHSQHSAPMVTYVLAPQMSGATVIPANSAAGSADPATAMNYAAMNQANAAMLQMFQQRMASAWANQQPQSQMQQQQQQQQQQQALLQQQMAIQHAVAVQQQQHQQQQQQQQQQHGQAVVLPVYSQNVLQYWMQQQLQQQQQQQLHQLQQQQMQHAAQSHQPEQLPVSPHAATILSLPDLLHILSWLRIASIVDISDSAPVLAARSSAGAGSAGSSPTPASRCHRCRSKSWSRRDGGAHRHSALIQSGQLRATA